MESNKSVTAVEWLVTRIAHGGLVSKKQFDELVKQAKAMEKEQLIMFGAQCMVEVEKESGLGAIKIYELYFDKTFKSE